MALTAWVGCAIAIETGPLSSTVTGPVLHADDGLTLPHLQAVPVSGAAPVATAAVHVPAPAAHHAAVVKPLTVAPLRSVVLAPVVHHGSTGATVVHRRPTHATAKPRPLQVGVDIPDPAATATTLASAPVVVITTAGPSTGDGTSTGTTPVVTTGPSGPVATGTDPGSGAQSTPLPPVDSTIPETPIPTPPAPPSSDPVTTDPTTDPSAPVTTPAPVSATPPPSATSTPMANPAPSDAGSAPAVSTPVPATGDVSAPVAG